MERNYLFRFGFNTPEQWVSNEEHGWEDEESSAFFVIASSKDEALEWGTEVAERAVRWLFRRAGWSEAPSWRASGFAHWIEEDENTISAVVANHVTPVVRRGEFPEFEGWIGRPTVEQE